MEQFLIESALTKMNKLGRYAPQEMDLTTFGGLKDARYCTCCKKWKLKKDYDTYNGKTKKTCIECGLRYVNRHKK